MTTEREATQTMFPNRATLRTAVAATLGILPILPIVAEAYGLTSIPWVASVVAVTAATTRLLSDPHIVQWLDQYAPWLSPDPTTQKEDEDESSTVHRPRRPHRHRRR